MNAAIAGAVMPDYFEKFQARVAQDFAEGLETWSQSVTALALWEDEHLLDDPSPGDLEAHQRTLDRLEAFGRFLAGATEHADFINDTARANISATLQTLRDKRALWHGSMPESQAEDILRAAFPR